MDRFAGDSSGSPRGGRDWSLRALRARVAGPRARRAQAVAARPPGKGGKSRRQPLPAGLARELRKLRDASQPEPTDPVFCGLAGGRLQETILADIIRRAAKRAGIEKYVTAHTLRHTAVTLLRQEIGDTASWPNTWGTPTSRPCRATHTSTAGALRRSGPARAACRPRR
jgi:integrase